MKAKVNENLNPMPISALQYLLSKHIDEITKYMFNCYLISNGLKDQEKQMEPLPIMLTSDYGGGSSDIFSEAIYLHKWEGDKYLGSKQYPSNYACKNALNKWKDETKGRWGACTNYK